MTPRPKQRRPDLSRCGAGAGPVWTDLGQMLTRLGDALQVVVVVKGAGRFGMLIDEHCRIASLPTETGGEAGGAQAAGARSL